MSIPVELEALQSKTDDYGWAYLLTVGDDMRPKIVAVPPEWHDGVLCLDAGRGSARNVGARSSVTVTYPPLDPDDYTLIIDGEATVELPSADGDDTPPRIHFAPTGAVLHRPAPAGFTNSSTGCSHDCAPVE